VSIEAVIASSLSSRTGNLDVEDGDDLSEAGLVEASHKCEPSPIGSRAGIETSPELPASISVEKTQKDLGGLPPSLTTESWSSTLSPSRGAAEATMGAPNLRLGSFLEKRGEGSHIRFHSSFVQALLGP
jgi:hypothetical protein